MSKNKKNKKREQHEIKERQFWDINPIQRVVPNKKKYNRKRDKREKEYKYFKERDNGE